MSSYQVILPMSEVMLSPHDNENIRVYCQIGGTVESLVTDLIDVVWQSAHHPLAPETLINSLDYAHVEIFYEQALEAAVETSTAPYNTDVMLHGSVRPHAATNPAVFGLPDFARLVEAYEELMWTYYQVLWPYLMRIPPRYANEQREHGNVVRCLGKDLVLEVHSYAGSNHPAPPVRASSL